MRVLVLLLCVLLSACAATDPASNPDARPLRDRVPGSAGTMGLAPDVPSVQTVQLYAGQNQQALPILQLGSGQTLTLAFDLLGTRGQALSVYYYHADRRWRRDLMAIDYMQGFQRDDLIQYTSSRGTQLPYTHYEHRFPQNGTAFTLSGNYILRVTEQGSEDAVLFERPFFVSEEGVAAELGLQPVLLGGGGGSSVQPIVQFAPLAEQGYSAFSYDVCFVQDGRYAAPRCTDQPTRTDPRVLTYYLQPTDAFSPNTGVYYLDLRDLRVSTRVEKLDLGQTPYHVTLSPDAALFPATVGDPLLNGQIVTRDARAPGDPALTAEYVEARFTFVPPDEAPLRSVYLSGAFSGWQRLAEPMTWVPDERHYTQNVLLKQGQYEYRYVSDDPQLARAQSNVLGRPDLSYTAFVYYRDPTRQTDRLIATRTGSSGL